MGQSKSKMELEKKESSEEGRSGRGCVGEEEKEGEEDHLSLGPAAHSSSSSVRMTPTRRVALPPFHCEMEPLTSVPERWLSSSPSIADDEEYYSLKVHSTAHFNNDVLTVILSFLFHVRFPTTSTAAASSTSLTCLFPPNKLNSQNFRHGEVASILSARQTCRAWMFGFASLVEEYGPQIHDFLFPRRAAYIYLHSEWMDTLRPLTFFSTLQDRTKPLTTIKKLKGLCCQSSSSDGVVAPGASKCDSASRMMEQATALEKSDEIVFTARLDRPEARWIVFPHWNNILGGGGGGGISVTVNGVEVLSSLQVSPPLTVDELSVESLRRPLQILPQGLKTVSKAPPLYTPPPLPLAHNFSDAALPSEDRGIEDGEDGALFFYQYPDGPPSTVVRDPLMLGQIDFTSNHRSTEQNPSYAFLSLQPGDLEIKICREKTTVRTTQSGKASCSNVKFKSHGLNFNVWPHDTLEDAKDILAPFTAPTESGDENVEPTWLVVTAVPEKRKKATQHQQTRAEVVHVTLPHRCRSGGTSSSSSPLIKGSNYNLFLCSVSPVEWVLHTPPAPPATTSGTGTATSTKYCSRKQRSSSNDHDDVVDDDGSPFLPRAIVFTQEHAPSASSVRFAERHPFFFTLNFPTKCSVICSHTGKQNAFFSPRGETT